MKKKPRKRKTVIEQFIDEEEVDMEEDDYTEPDVDEMYDKDEDLDPNDSDGCTVIDFRGVPETGKAVQFVHAGGKVTATVLKINPNGTFYAVGRDRRNTKYPNVHPEDILGENEDAVTHINKRKKPLAPTKNPRALGDQPRGGIIGQIIKLHEQGLSKADIIARGFNKSTVSRQVGEYIKRQKQK